VKIRAALSENPEPVLNAAATDPAPPPKQVEPAAATASSSTRELEDSTIEGCSLEGDTMITVDQKLIQMTAELEVLNKSLVGLQQKMLSAKGLKKKVLKKSCFDLDAKTAERREVYGKLMANPTGHTWGMDHQKWKAMQASKRLRGEI